MPGKDAVAIVEYKLLGFEAHRLTKLLQCPSRRRVCRHVDVLLSTRAVMNDYKYIEQPECRRDSDKEIARDYALGMVQ